MKHEPALCRDGIAESVAHHHRMLAVDRVTELDTVIARLSQLHPLDYIFIQLSCFLSVLWCRYDGESVRPAGANIRSFLIECLAGPLVGSDPRQVHAFCDLYEQARHSYKQFGAREYGSYAQLLDQLTRTA